MGDEIISLLKAVIEASGTREGAVIGLVLSLTAMLTAAFYQFRFFSDLHDLHAFIDQAIKDARARVGAPPRHLEARIRRQKRIRDVVNQTWRSLWQRFWLFAATGILFPCLFLFAVTLNYDALHPGAVAFVDSSQGKSFNALTLEQTAIFVMDQLTRGALFDFAEVYRIKLTAITNDSENCIYSTVLFLFRFLTGLFTGTLGWILIRFLWARHSRKFNDHLYGKSDEDLGL